MVGHQLGVAHRLRRIDVLREGGVCIGIIALHGGGSEIGHHRGDLAGILERCADDVAGLLGGFAVYGVGQMHYLAEVEAAQYPHVVAAAGDTAHARCAGDGAGIVAVGHYGRLGGDTGGIGGAESLCGGHVAGVEAGGHKGQVGRAAHGACHGQDTACAR